MLIYIAGLRLAVLGNSTSGIPVTTAQTPRAVPYAGVKHRSKKIPCLHISLKYGVVFKGFPHMLLL